MRGHMKTEWKKYRKAILLLFSGICVLAFAAGGSAWYLTVFRNGRNENEQQRPAVQQERTARMVTEEGSVSVGTVSQTFEIDLSEFSGENSQTFS